MSNALAIKNNPKACLDFLSSIREEIVAPTSPPNMKAYLC